MKDTNERTHLPPASGCFTHFLSMSQDDSHKDVAQEEGRPRVEADCCFLKEDCTIDERVRGQSELHQRITTTDANNVSDNISSDHSRVSAKNYDMKGHAAKNVLDGIANSLLKLLRNSSKRQHHASITTSCRKTTS